MTDALHHQPLQDLSEEVWNGKDHSYEVIKNTLEEYVIAMLKFSLINAETFFQNILSQMAPICLKKPEIEKDVLSLLLSNWYVMGFDDFDQVMGSISYMRDHCLPDEVHRMAWLDSLIDRPDLIRRTMEKLDLFDVEAG